VTAKYLNSFDARQTLSVGANTYTYYSLRAAERSGLSDVSRLPFSLKVIIENMLRNEHGQRCPGVRSRLVRTELKRKRGANG
jgi:aconitase A